MSEGADPWVLPSWTQTGCGSCDGCGRCALPVMRVKRGGVAMCERCHGEFMAAWRAQDAASEYTETIDGFRHDTLGVQCMEHDDAPAPIAMPERRAA